MASQHDMPTCDSSCRVLVLDEVDQLNSQILYTLFEWPAVPKSRVILLGRFDKITVITFTSEFIPRELSKIRKHLLNSTIRLSS